MIVDIALLFGSLLSLCLAWKISSTSKLRRKNLGLIQTNSESADVETKLHTENMRSHAINDAIHGIEWGGRQS